MIEDYQFYCLSFNSVDRKENMTRRFKTIGIDCIFYEGVSCGDDRITGRNISSRVWSCIYGHLDMISEFYYNSDKQFGIFCEDDLYLNKNLKLLIPKIMVDFVFMNLDVLLLGYLINFEIKNDTNHFKNKNTLQNSNEYKYYDFPNDLWGSQMYMLSRNSAKKILDKYSFSSGYADKTLLDSSLINFSADWIITKYGNKAIVYPMLAIEDNQTHYDHSGQYEYHKSCFDFNFDTNIFIT